MYYITLYQKCFISYFFNVRNSIFLDELDEDYNDNNSMQFEANCCEYVLILNIERKKNQTPKQKEMKKYTAEELKYNKIPHINCFVTPQFQFPIIYCVSIGIFLIWQFKS